MRIWISRDENDGDSDSSCVNMTESKPFLSNENNQTWVFACKGYMGFMRADEFENKFGILIPKGFCQEFELVLEPIKND